MTGPFRPAHFKPLSACVCVAQTKAVYVADRQFVVIFDDDLSLVSVLCSTVLAHALFSTPHGHARGDEQHILLC